MMLKQLTGKLREQEWSKAAIELVIVILGVFMGTWVANLNQARIERAETRRMIRQLQPTLREMSNYWHYANRYYAVGRAYGAVAIAGWRGDRRVSDADFVVAAYQASQIFVRGINGATWSTILGVDRLRDIDDPKLRNALSFLMSTDYSQIDLPAVDTPYRHDVRGVIPIEVQDAIRARCGDRRAPENPALLILPAQCVARLSPADAKRAATLLRARPALLAELQWHLAASAAFLANIIPYELAARRVELQITRDLH